MQYAYVRCMDGHYYLLTDNPRCPLDGSLTRAAEQVLPMLGAIAGRLSLPLTRSLKRASLTTRWLPSL